jgi:hypothetical protein
VRLQEFIGKVGDTRLFRRKALVTLPPTLAQGERFPYGPFRFRSQIPRGSEYMVLAASDLTNWLPIAKGATNSDVLEYLDSDASKFSHRFYRLIIGEVSSANVLGFASITLPPGFSLIANPLDGASNNVAEMFKGWPEGTTLSKFDTRMFKLGDNGVKNGKWTNPSEKLLPGEGAIFFNPTQDYKSHAFVGDVLQGHLSVPVPSGFSMRSSLMPLPGNLADDLKFPISDGDVIHIFDRDRQRYVLHPFDGGKWTAGPPVLSVGESFWVAKTSAGNWTRNFSVEG